MCFLGVGLVGLCPTKSASSPFLSSNSFFLPISFEYSRFTHTVEQWQTLTVVSQTCVTVLLECSIECILHCSLTVSWSVVASYFCDFLLEYLDLFHAVLVPKHPLSLNFIYFSTILLFNLTMIYIFQIIWLQNWHIPIKSLGALPVCEIKILW